jgi:hypothetical protein
MIQIQDGRRPWPGALILALVVCGPSAPASEPSPDETELTVQLEAFSAADCDDVWAVGSKLAPDAAGNVGRHLLAMRWDGRTWRDMEAPWPSERAGRAETDPYGEQFYDVVALASDDVWMIGDWWSTDPGGGMRWPGVAMRWNGTGFDVFELPLVSPESEQWPLALGAISSDDVWVVGDGAGTNEPLYTWHWDGAEWRHVPGPTPGVDRALEWTLPLSSADVWAGGWYHDADGTWHSLLVQWDGERWTHRTPRDVDPDLLARCARRLEELQVRPCREPRSAETQPQASAWHGICDSCARRRRA